MVGDTLFIVHLHIRFYFTETGNCWRTFSFKQLKYFSTFSVQVFFFLSYMEIDFTSL